MQLAERQAKANQDLQTAARLQDEAAKGFAEHPEERDQNQQKEREAMAKLQEAIQNDPRLQDPQGAAAGAEGSGAGEPRSGDPEAGDPAAEPDGQAGGDGTGPRAGQALADKQQKLNDQIQQAAKDDHNALDQAHVQTPNADQQKNIVQALDKNELDNAAAQMKQQAAQLQQAAQQLQQQANADTPQPTVQEQQAQQQDQQKAQAAQQDQVQANQAAQEPKQDGAAGGSSSAERRR